ncbi:MAG: 3-hydroxyacyl-ACP dehydratase FabZ family protein [Candidatus Limiplasma sp.]|nr:3-hydroxyacyl-ACP dehydratase FabZ family protein [Candidatus Limiplasma sp.]
MNRDEIKQLLPHREPMLLLDTLDMQGETAIGRYAVRGDEWFLQGHFPGNPVVPGVVLCEMIGQSCAVLLGDRLKGKTPMFAGINRVKFRRSARPGDTILLTARITRSNGPFFIAQGEASVDGQPAAQGEFSFALVENEAAAPKA